jgi:uncharacterized heparinase superfamily protein
MSMLGHAGRYWRTIRWLKAEQLIGRIRFTLRRAAPDLRPAPPLRAMTGPLIAVARREPSLTAPQRMRFLGEEHELAQVGWDDTDLALLWRYNQHYFDDLNAAGAAVRQPWHRALVQRWIADNAAGRGTAWASYPTSLRIVNWVKWFTAGEFAQPAWLDSLAAQVRWLSGRLEWHLLGNHLFVNAKALVFAGLFFNGDEASGWQDQGLRILERELPEQILPDGGQFERSPMYHALALEDLLDLLNVIRAFAPSSATAGRLAPLLERCTQAMLGWLRCMRHPGGALARFNDATEGVAPSSEELERYAAALGIEAPAAPDEGIVVLEPSGYTRAVRGLALLLMDVAPIGPDYLPGHAHADTLSFELSLGGREIVVNRGTSVYGTGPRRQWERSTAAHSTVQVGAHDSSEVWAGFRVGRRARVRDARVDGWSVEASHDGYSHLPGAPWHHRRWRLGHGSLLVEDRIEPAGREAAMARFHFAPGLTLEPLAGPLWRVSENGRERLRVVVDGARQEATQHAEGFGKLVPAATLCVPLHAGRAQVRFDWNV